MRWWPLLLLIPLAAAQGLQPEPVPVLSDPKGDVLLDQSGFGAQNPTPRFAALDLVSANVQEFSRDLVFTLQVASLDTSTEPPLAESGFYAVHFTQGDVPYAVQIGRFRSVETGVFGQLSRYDPAQDTYYAVDYLPVTMDPVAATFTATVSRDLIVDSQGARPYPGRSLTGFWAESKSFMELFTFPITFTGQPATKLRDRMPDQGDGTPLPILLGPEQIGGARLSSPQPTRQSNGEATTFLFSVEARNDGETPDRYRILTRNVPAGWNLTLPETLVSLAPGASRLVPVLVTVPFAHDHGTFKSFLVAMESTTGLESRAELELGVRYPKVPQPAGHHDTLFLHGAKWADDPTLAVYATAFSFNTEVAWMNALEADPADQRVPVPSDATFHIVPPVPGTFRWTVPLSPDLGMGLDFDLARTGSFKGDFTVNAPILGAVLSGTIDHYVDSRFDEFGTRYGGNRTILADLLPSEARDLQTTGSFEVTVVPRPEADLVPYQERSALVLILNLTGMRPDTFQGREPPRLMPGATLHLPLFEYHDPVDASFTSNPSLRFTTPVQDRLVNPGRTALFPVLLHLQEGMPVQSVRLTLSGPDASMARITRATEASLRPGQALEVPVALTIPEGVGPRSVDIILQADSRTDPTLTALLRLYATVVTDRDVPDEADLVAAFEESDEESSALIWPILVALVVASRRRR